MLLETRGFSLAYKAYYDAINKYGASVTNVLEVGGGAHPAIANRKNIKYTIVDPDDKELNKAPEDTIKINASVEELKSDIKYDLITSKMVLEHIPNPDEFHTKVKGLLTENGVSIHFFACRHSIPAFVNRFLPEFLGDFILRCLGNRDLENRPKYKAYYKRTKGHTDAQLSYFKDLGYAVVEYHSFVGHSYFRNIPVLNQLEKLFTAILSQLKAVRLSTVALVILKK